MSIGELHVYEELANIVKGQPLWPGDTLSHVTATQCVERGWARRDDAGNFVATDRGVAEYSRYVEHENPRR